jgi:hypothetical protein
VGDDGEQEDESSHQSKKVHQKKKEGQRKHPEHESDGNNERQKKTSMRWVESLKMKEKN